MFAGFFASMPAYDKYFEDDVASRTRRLEGWQKELAKEGIESEAVIDQKSSYTVDAILKYAEQMKNGLIAIIHC